MRSFFLIFLLIQVHHCSASALHALLGRTAVGLTVNATSVKTSNQDRMSVVELPLVTLNRTRGAVSVNPRLRQSVEKRTNTAAVQTRTCATSFSSLLRSGVPALWVLVPMVKPMRAVEPVLHAMSVHHPTQARQMLHQTPSSGAVSTNQRQESSAMTHRDTTAARIRITVMSTSILQHGEAKNVPPQRRVGSLNTSSGWGKI